MFTDMADLDEVNHKLFTWQKPRLIVWEGLTSAIIGSNNSEFYYNKTNDLSISRATTVLQFC